MLLKKLVVLPTQEVKIELTWSEDNIQTIVINLPEDIMLEQPEEVIN